MTVLATVPKDHGLAVFLDVDGTLLDIADTPDAVVVPPGLTRLLADMQAHPVHAFALISGRSLAALDRLFAPHRFPAAGLHGVERRDAAGVIHRLPIQSARLATVRAALLALVRSHPAFLLEDKCQALALHFRGAPDLEPLAESAMADALLHAGPDYHLQRGKAVIEMKPRAGTKRTAIEAFMGEEPFRGRVPVFIGDDVTDEDGFAAVNSQGGLSVRVGARGDSVARETLPDVATVYSWLQALFAGKSVHEQ